MRRACRKDEELIQALELFGEKLSAGGNTAGAAEARTIAVGLWQAVREHGDALKEVDRLAERTKRHEGSYSEKVRMLHLAHVTLRDKATSLKAARERGQQLLKVA